MDAHRITGAIKNLAGHAEEAVGTATGDTKATVSGKARQVEGTAERQFGEWLDIARDLARDRPLLALAGAGALAFTLGALIAGPRGN